MANSSTTADLSPPPPVSVDGGFNYQTTTTASAAVSTVASSKTTSSSSVAENLSPSILVTVLILATAVIVSASLYLLLRLISRNCNRRRPRTDAVDSLRILNHHNNNQNQRHSAGGGGGLSRRVSPEEIGGGSVIDSLPIFTFASINRAGNRSNGGGENGDCAVCLSKFEPEDQLRLLPLCCHAFHSACIDAWISANQTCPLCRSPIFVSESEILRKINMTSSSGGNRSGSFRIELGSISRRRIEDINNNNRRSYSIGSFDYIVDDSLSEITVESSSLRPMTDLAGTEKDDAAARNVAAEVGGGGRNWLREYAERLTSSFSLSSSFRSSGRFFTGSSRRNELNAVRNSDLEASRLGDEIGEMFRWLSPSGA